MAQTRRRLLAGLLVAVAACGAPPAPIVLAPSSSAPTAEETPPPSGSVASEPPARLPGQVRSIPLAEYRARGRAELVDQLRSRCPEAAATAPLHPHPGPYQDDGDKTVTVQLDAEAIVVTRPGRDSYDDEGESYAWTLEWIWAVDIETCAVHQAATSRYSTSVYDSEDTHRLVGVKRGAARIPLPLRVRMLGAEPVVDDPASATTLLHQGPCAEHPEHAGLGAWDLVPLLQMPPPSLAGPAVAQRRTFVPMPLNTDSFDWPAAFVDADLEGIGIVHPASDDPKIEQTLGERQLVSVRMHGETLFAVQDAERHRWLASSEGCVPGTFSWAAAGDDIVVASVVGLEDEPAKETWMVLGRGHGGVVVFDLRTGLAHELRSGKTQGQPLPATGELRAALRPTP